MLSITARMLRSDTPISVRQIAPAEASATEARKSPNVFCADFIFPTKDKEQSMPKLVTHLVLLGSLFAVAPLQAQKPAGETSGEAIFEEICTEVEGLTRQERAQHLQQLLQKRPHDSLVLLALAQVAAREQRIRDAVPFITELADLGAVHDRVLWMLVGYAADESDYALLEAATAKFCHSAAAQLELRGTDLGWGVGSLEHALLWRLSPDAPEFIRAMTRQIGELSPQLREAPAFFRRSPADFWPDDLPLTQAGLDEAIGRQTKKVADEKERYKEVDAKLAEIRSKKLTETQYQIEMAKLERKLYRPEAEKLALMQRIPTKIAPLLTKGSEAASWKIAIRVWAILNNSPIGNLSTWLDQDWQSELARRGHPEAMAAKMVKRALYGMREAPPATQLAEIRSQLEQGQGAGHSPPPVRCAAALVALKFNDYELARKALTSPADSPVWSHELVRLQIELDLATKANADLQTHLQHYIDGLAALAAAPQSTFPRFGTSQERVLLEEGPSFLASVKMKPLPRASEELIDRAIETVRIHVPKRPGFGDKHYGGIQDFGIKIENRLRIFAD